MRSCLTCKSCSKDMEKGYYYCDCFSGVTHMEHHFAKENKCEYYEPDEVKVMEAIAEKALECNKPCDIDYRAENKAQAEMIARLKDENYNLKMAVKHLSEVIMNGYKDFGF